MAICSSLQVIGDPGTRASSHRDGRCQGVHPRATTVPCHCSAGSSATGSQIVPSKWNHFEAGPRRAWHQLAADGFAVARIRVDSERPKVGDGRNRSDNSPRSFRLPGTLSRFEGFGGPPGYALTTAGPPCTTARCSLGERFSIRDRGRLELGCAGLRVRGVDGQQVGGDVVLEVKVMNVRPGRSDSSIRTGTSTCSAARSDPDAFAVGQAVRSASSGLMSRLSPRRSGEVYARRSARRCCRSRAGGRSSAGSGNRHRACRPAGRGQPE